MKRISKYSILVVGALIVVGAFSACSFHGGPEHRAQWVMEKVTKKLKLNDAQQVQLNYVSEEIKAAREATEQQFAVGEFYDGLTGEQQAKVREFAKEHQESGHHRGRRHND